MLLKKNHLYLLSILSGLIFSLAWTNYSLGLFLLLAFVPLLLIENNLCNNKQKNHSFKMFGFSYLAFFVWHLISIWWIYNASLFGMVMAVLFNSLFMAVVFWAFHIVKRKYGEKLGYISLVAFWIAFEYLHVNWELAWPWMNIGNGFSRNIRLIQWYEYTGTLGGSLWILVVNLMIFYLIKKKAIEKTIIKNYRIFLATLISLIIIPILISFSIYYTYNEHQKPVNIVVVQPNIDPYNEKFGGMTAQDQLRKLLNLAVLKIDSNTEYLVCPETALVDGLWEEDLSTSNSVIEIRKLIKQYPKLKIITGLSSYGMHKKGEKLLPAARKFTQENAYYYSYNSAIQIDSTPNIQIYHKSKLVLGVEKMPFAESLSFLKDIAIDLGGISGTLGIQENRSVFINSNNSTKVAPVICFESVFGEFIGEYVKNGADFIFVITNDGWWKDTPGYGQHLSYSSLRAIETRRSIARSANTGISCFVNQSGEILQPTKWWEPAVIKASINKNTKITFYVTYGDYLGRLTAYLTLLILVYTIAFALKKQ